jgi:phytoene synthase
VSRAHAVDPSADPTLRASYERCRRVNREHGTTYYWSTRVLPRDKQPHVFAVYAFCRHADDIVDDLGDGATAAQRAEALAGFGDRFFADLRQGWSDHELLAATVATVRRWHIDPDCFRRFLRSMAMDLTVDRYETWDDLCGYMDGSAAVIGEMVLPILEPLDPAAVEPARTLGIAFQLTNFLRDVGEDLDRGRVYLPQEDLARFGADPWARTVTPEWRDLMRFEIDRARALYVEADRGIALLPDRSARCIAAARRLYSGILDRIEAADYDVFTTRARVPTTAKVRLAAQALIGRSRPTPVGASRPRSTPTTGNRNP